MRRLQSLTLGIVLGLPVLAGCHLFNNSRSRDTSITVPNATDQKPTTESLVRYLNQNNKIARSLQAKLEIDAKQGAQAVAISGGVAARQPRELRLRGAVFGTQAVDLGSNNNEFWYRVKQMNPDYYYK